jgi:hypothetical protein
MCTECPKCIYDTFHSKDIKKYICNDEYIEFIGYYDIQHGNVENNIHTSSCNIIKNNEGYNIKTTQFYCVEDNQKKFINETYNITSYSKTCECQVELEKVCGMISFCGLYENENKKKPMKFNVNSSSGIYKNVVSVVIDFSENIRKIYFLGKKNKRDIKIIKKDKKNKKNKK